MSPIDRLSLSELRTAARRLAEITQNAERLFDTCTTRRIIFCKTCGRDSDLDEGRMHALVLLGLIDPPRLIDIDKRAIVRVEARAFGASPRTRG